VARRIVFAAVDQSNAEALVQEMQAAWNTHDMKRFAACFAEDADFVNVAGAWVKGRDDQSRSGPMRGSGDVERIRGDRSEVCPPTSSAHARKAR
jgi:hypothetical protein